ncbi:hypothetical protein BURCENBC7_AP2177 [Burkholderia cenocepacia BC7]|nr:hypothetical protein BURCENBC7_AP2177 [Burkholderia cenocepacia BC7]
MPALFLTNADAGDAANRAMPAASPPSAAVPAAGGAANPRSAVGQA